MTGDAFPDVTGPQKELVARYRSLITNTGGNEAEDLLQRLQGPGGARLVQTNIIVWAMASDVRAQVALLGRLESCGKLQAGS